MANHVTYSFDFENVNDEGKQFLEGIFEGKDDLHQTEFEGQNLSECGPKWATINDTDGYLLSGGNTFSVYGESAWSPPTDYVEALYGALLKVSPEATAQIHYADEAPNFAGVYFWEPVFNAEGDFWEPCIDGVELDNEEIFELWSEEYSDDFNNALESVADEEGITKEELLEQQEDFYDLVDYDAIQEVFYDQVWEVISNYQAEQLNMLKGG
jgi:hypothetical protein